MRQIVDIKGEIISRRLLSPDEAKDTELTIAPEAQRSLFAGAKVTRLESFLGDVGEVNRNIYDNLFVMRARCRQLAMDDNYIVKYLSVAVQETLGSKGLKLAARGPDDEVNKLIDDLYVEWSEDCCTSGDMSMIDYDKLSIRTRHCDGEFFARMVPGYEDNDFRFALFPFDADRLELGFDAGPWPNGSYIRNSIEYNKWARPLAYHILERHPGDHIARWPDGHFRMRIPVDEIVHFFEPLRPGQGRGLPSMHAAIVSAKHRGAYIKSTIVAARVIASKFAAIVSSELDAHKQNIGEVNKETGEIINKVEAGRIFRLRPGEDLKIFDPKQPSGQYEPFIKNILRGESSGLSVSYASLSGDLTGTSFASGRLGALEIQVYWDLNRQNFISRNKIRTYRKWLHWAWLTQDRLYNKVSASELPLYIKKVIVYDKATVWIDPDTTSKVIERNLNVGITTLKAELAKLGIDYEPHIEQLLKEKEDLKKLNEGVATDDQESKLNIVKDKKARN